MVRKISPNFRKTQEKRAKFREFFFFEKVPKFRANNIRFGVIFGDIRHWGVILLHTTTRGSLEAFQWSDSGCCYELSGWWMEGPRSKFMRLAPSDHGHRALCTPSVHPILRKTSLVNFRAKSFFLAPTMVDPHVVLNRLQYCDCILVGVVPQVNCPEHNRTQTTLENRGEGVRVI